MSIELKIKSKHLSVESKIIKFEEAKLKKQIRWHSRRLSPNHKLEWKLNSLVHHRRHDVRIENRATYLARAFIAQKPYKMVEQSRTAENEHTFRTYVIPRVVAMLQKYHLRTLTRDDVLKWINA